MIRSTVERRQEALTSPAMREKLGDEVVDRAQDMAVEKAERFARNPAEGRKYVAETTWRWFAEAQNQIKGIPASPFDGVPADRNPLASDATGLGAILDRLREVGTMNASQGINVPKFFEGSAASEYLGTRTADDVTIVEPNIEKLTADMRTIDALLPLYPEPQSQRALLQIKQSLNALRAIDPIGLLKAARQEMLNDSPASKALNQSARMAGTMFFGAAAFLATGLALLRRERSIAPLLYAGAALYCANPQLLKGRDAAIVRESAAFLKNPAFVERIAPRYRMQGQEWANALATMKEIEKADASRLKRFEQQTTEKENEELAQEIAPGGRNPARADVERLLANKKDFKAVRIMLGSVADAEALELVQSYVREGAWKYAGRGDAYAANGVVEEGFDA